jgi:hypothetical protein
MSPSPHVFEDAIETLQQLKSTFSPTEKLLVIRQTVEKMTPVAQELLGENYVWNMDDLFPIFLFVVVRARIPDLGSELDFVDNFMDPSLESGELGIMYTTLKVSRGGGFSRHTFANRVFRPVTNKSYKRKFPAISTISPDFIFNKAETFCDNTIILVIIFIYFIYG